jgi:CP family cyanate transporter-like MFS transporter
MPHHAHAGSASGYLIALALLWLAGTALRLSILSIPPVIPLIHDDLHMSETQVGILMGLPSVLFALAAVPGSLLIARFGVVPTLVAGLLISGVASGLRGAVLDISFLYAMTILTGFGVSIMQVAMPPAVRAWAPHRIGFATAVYTNGLLVGEILPVALMLPLIMPLAGGSWRWGMVAWAIPVVMIGLIVIAFAPRDAPAGAAVNGRQWWPNWKDPMIWRLGLMLGAVNAMYFAANGFLPDYLTSIGRRDLISPTLTAMNVCQLPASFILLAVAGRLEARAWPYVATGLLSFFAIVGMVTTSGVWIVVSAGVLGFAAAAVLILILALPPLLSAPGDVHRTTAAMFTISYSCAVVVPVVSGMAWDLSGIPASAFVPIALCALMLAGLAFSIDLDRYRKAV